jgi:glycosyltransferase involved in cell wall biosynthesis
MARAHNECRDIQKITPHKKNGTPARVWMVASVPPHCQGGVHRVMRAHARALQAAGVRATLWYNECGMHDLVFTWYVLVKWLWALLRRRAPHVMVSRSTDGVWCALVSRIVPSPTTCVLYNHGWEEYAGEVYRDVQRHAGAWKSRLVRYVLLRLHLYTCRRCICGTVADMKWLRAHYPARAHVLRFVPNGVHVPRYGSDMAIRTQRRFRIRGTYRFLVVGQDTWRKHLDYAIALCHRLVTHFTIPVSLYCVGTGTQGARRIHTRWAGSPLAVHCSAGESMERMDRWYAHCPFVVSASRYEGGHSLALLEAMAHGCVVWAAPIPAHREFIRHGRNGFLLGAGDIDRDATQVAAVLDDRRTLCSVSRYARRSAWRHRWQRQNTRFFRAIAVTP